MKKRMIAAVAAVMMAAASMMPLACAGNAADASANTAEFVVTEQAEKNDEAAPAAAEATATATDLEADVADTKATAAAMTETAEAAAETPAAVTPADLKTHRVFCDVAATFQVKVGRVSARTSVCLWNTDCRKASSKIRRLSADETLTVVAENNGWFKVVDSNGTTGFVVRSRVTLA